MPVRCKAIDRVTDKHGRTIGYVLVDENGLKMSVDSQRIKNAIRNNQISVTNLKIASNGKLIYNTVTENHNVDESNNNCISIKISELYTNANIIMQTYGIDMHRDLSSVDNPIVISINNKDLKLKLINDKSRDFYSDNFTNTYTHKPRIKIKQSYIGSLIVENVFDLYREKPDITIIDTTVSNMEIYSANVILHTIFAKYVKLNKCHTQVCTYMNFIEKAEIINDYKNYIGSIACATLNIETQHDDYYFDSSLQIANNINIKSTCDGNFGLHASNLYAKNLNIYCSNRVVLYIDNFNDYHESILQGLYKVEQYSDSSTLNLIYNTINNNFSNYLKTKCNININNNNRGIIPKNLVLNGSINCKFDYDFWSSEHTKDKETGMPEINTETNNIVRISSDFLTNIADKNGDININTAFVIANEAELDVNNIIVNTFQKYFVTHHVNKDGRLSKKKEYTKGYILSDLGLLAVDKQIGKFTLRIKGEILAANKKSEEDRYKVVKQLAELSRHNGRIIVNFNTKLYHELKALNANIEVYNCNEAMEKMQNTAYKEDLMNSYIFSNMASIIRDANANKEDSNREFYIRDLNWLVNIDIPREVKDVFKIVTSSAETDTLNTTEYAILILLKNFKLNNTPFTKAIVNRMTTDSNFSVDIETKDFDDGIKLHTILIGYSSIKTIDKYILMTNGNKLIYMCYVGEAISILGHVINRDRLIAVNELRRLQSVDITHKVIVQNMTINTDGSAELVKEIENFINGECNFIINNNKLYTLGLDNNDNIVTLTFNIEYDKSKKSIFDNKLAIDTASKITYIEKESGISGIKEIEKKIEKSILYNIINNVIGCDIDTDNSYIPKAKISTLYIIANGLKHISKGNAVLDYDQIEELLSLPTFNNISESEAKWLSQYISKYCSNPIKSNGTYEIFVKSLNTRSKKFCNKYMTSMEEFIVIRGERGTRYYVGSIEINKYINTIIKINEQLENLSGKDLNKFNAENLMLVLKENGLNLPPSKAYERFRDAECYNDTRLADYKKSLVKVFNVGRASCKSYKRLDRIPEVGTSICIDVATGYMYFVADIGELTMPILRLSSFRKAAEVLAKEISDIRENKRGNDCSLTLNLVDKDSILAGHIINQYNNIKTISSYRELDNWNYVIDKVSYAPDFSDREYEDFCVDDNINENKDDNAVKKSYTPKEMKGYRQDYLVKYIQMGAFTIVQALSNKYKKITEYTIANESYKITEYYNSEDNTFAYDIGNDTHLTSECRMEELMDI